MCLEWSGACRVSERSGVSVVREADPSRSNERRKNLVSHSLPRQFVPSWWWASATQTPHFVEGRVKPRIAAPLQREHQTKSSDKGTATQCTEEQVLRTTSSDPSCSQAQTSTARLPNNNSVADVVVSDTWKVATSDRCGCGSAALRIQTSWRCV